LRCRDAATGRGRGGILSVVSGVLALLTNPTFISRLLGIIIWIAYAFGALIALSLVVAVTPWVFDKLRTASAPMRIAIIIFAIVPTFFVALTVLIALFSNYAPLVLRCLFLAFAILIPPGLYYLFIATRRDSLLNAYVSNLSRLGLLRRQCRPQPAGSDGATVEAENDRVRRVHGYIERFEALYGKLPIDYISKVLCVSLSCQGL
jgi:hypothetical protein